MSCVPTGHGELLTDDTSSKMGNHPPILVGIIGIDNCGSNDGGGVFQRGTGAGQPQLAPDELYSIAMGLLFLDRRRSDHVIVKLCYSDKSRSLSQFSRTDDPVHVFAFAATPPVSEDLIPIPRC